MDAESFPYTDNRQQQTDRHARSDKGEAADGIALKSVLNGLLDAFSGSFQGHEN